MPHPTAQPPLVVLDCDSTAIQDEVIELLADSAGTRDRVELVTERAMRGEIDFEQSLRQRVAMLAGLPEEVFEQTVARLRLTPGLLELIAAVHEQRGFVGIVSGGFHEVLDPLAREIGVDRWRANRLEVRDGRLTGALVGPVVDAAAKAAALLDWAKESGIPRAATVAIGDGANDLEMMRVAALSIAFNAKPIVREAAQVSIDGDLALVIPLLRQLGS